MLKIGVFLPVAMAEALDHFVNITKQCCVRDVKCEYKGVPQIATVITRVSDL